MRHRIWIFFPAILCLFYISRSAPCHAESKKFTVGISSALTGPAANYGLDVKDAILFANEKFGEGKFEFIIEDDKCNGKDAVSVAKKFTAIDHVDAVLGFACSGAALAAAPIYEAAQIPTIISCASSPKIAQSGDYIFRTFPSDAFAAATLRNYIDTKGHVQLAILAEETEYAQDFRTAFETSSAHGKLLTESFLPDTADFKSQLLKIKSSGVDALFLLPQAEGTFATILKQLEEIDWHPMIYGAYWPSSPALISLVGDKLNGVEFVDSPSLAMLVKKEYSGLVDEFVERYGSPRSVEAVFATSFEAFRILKASLESPGSPTEYLNQLSFNSIFGPISFDENGEIRGFKFVIKRVTDRSPILIQ